MEESFYPVSSFLISQTIILPAEGDLSDMGELSRITLLIT